VGGSKISADWTGFMERHIRERTGTDIVVFPLIAPQGNINHFDFHSPEKQTSYEETERIGRSYGGFVLEALDRTEPVEVSGFQGRIETCTVPPHEIDASELEAARGLASQKIQPGKGGDLTAEDLFFGDSTVNRLFARELLDYAAAMPDHYDVPLQALKIGKTAICAIPGEPFVEIGLALKESAGFQAVFPVALANSYFSYIPMKECFERGGYEVKASKHNCLSRNAAECILSTFRSMLASLSQAV
jgi:hypothetical protein